MNWSRTRLKYVAECNSHVLAESTDPDLEFAYIDISGVSQGQLAIPDQRIRFGAAPSRARRIAESGDTVVSTVRTYLRAVAMVPEFRDQLVFSTGFAVLHPLSNVDRRYLAWYLQADEFVSRVEAASTGVSYPAITASELMSLDLRLPELQEQREIADYLDRETAQIDTLITKQVQLIEALRERRAVGIKSVVAGLPGDMVRLGWYCTVSSGESIPIDDVDREDGPIPVIGGNGVMGFTTRSNVDVSTLAIGRVGALCGNVHRVDPPAWVTDNALRLHRIDGFEIDYLARVLTSMNLNDLSRSTAQPLITGSQVADIRIPRPTRSDQLALVQHIDASTSKIDTLIAKAGQFIALAKERRAALITAAVTGQIDVGAAA